MQLTVHGEATQLDFHPIESFERKDNSQFARTKMRNIQPRDQVDADVREWVPTQLENGKWACNHKCKDKKG